MLEQERLILFTGHFGSGKTELALNYSVQAAARGKTTILVDLDIVNPFFRSTEVRELLADKGVQVLSPTFAATASDVPSLPAEIYSVFANREALVIFDVGGDDVGARALGRYFPYFSKEPYRMFYVINAKRPLSAVKEDIFEMLEAVENKSRLKVTDLINNTNLSYETCAEDILEGQSVIEEVSRETGLPIRFISGLPRLLDALPAGLAGEFFPIDCYMKPPWR